MEAWMLVVIGIGGGMGAEAIRAWFARRNHRDTTAADIRGELREDLERLREELNQVKQDADRWRESYYELKEQCLSFELELKHMRKLLGEQ